MKHTGNFYLTFTLSFLCLIHSEAWAGGGCSASTKKADEAAIATAQKAATKADKAFTAKDQAMKVAQKKSLGKSNVYQGTKAKWEKVQNTCNLYTKDYKFYDNLCMLAKAGCSEGVRQDCSRGAQSNCTRAAKDDRKGTPVCNHANSLNTTGQNQYSAWQTADNAYISANNEAIAAQNDKKTADQALKDAQAKLKSDGC